MVKNITFEIGDGLEISGTYVVDNDGDLVEWEWEDTMLCFDKGKSLYVEVPDCINEYLETNAMDIINKKIEREDYGYIWFGR